MDSEITPLVGELPADRIISEPTPVYVCNGTILYLDDKNTSSGDFYSGAEIAYENPVPVKDDTGKLIGFADLSVDSNAVEAKFFLDYHTPERLSIETSSEKLYPSLSAQEQLMEMEDNHWHIIYMLIDEIVLTKNPQPDSRILPL